MYYWLVAHTLTQRTPPPPPPCVHAVSQCAKEAIGAAVSLAGGRAWSYRFHHGLSFGPALWGPRLGLPQCATKVCHTAELTFVFGNTGEWSFTDEERAFSDALLDAWAAFARTGDPNQVPPAGAPFAWPAFDNATRLSAVLRPGWGAENSSATCPFWDRMGYAQH